MRHQISIEQSPDTPTSSFATPEPKTQDETMEVEGEKNVSNVLKLMEQPMKKGESWYLVDRKWFETFKKFVTEGGESQNPGPVDNSGLFKNKDGVELKERLQEHLDYVFVPAAAWELLIQHFKIVNEKQIIKRQVIEQGQFSTYSIVEVYPIELKLCLYDSQENTIIKPFSRVTTLRDLETAMRRLFNVEASKESQLWANDTALNPPADAPANGASPSGKKNDNHTLSEASITNSQTLVALEIRNDDGTWTSSRPRDEPTERQSPKTTPGLCGLNNLGNTCFMNSALQCMSNTQPLTDYFLRDGHLSELNEENPLGMGGQIARTYGELIKAMWSGDHTSIAPRDFKTAVGRFAPQFSGYQQHDCQELMAFLMDGLHEDLNRITIKPYIEISREVENRPDAVVATESWNNHKKRNDSVIVDTFHAQLKSTLVCPDCELVSVTFDPFCFLSLPLPVSRERAMKVTFVPVQPSGDASEYLKPVKIPSLTIPKQGKISEISNATAKMINEHNELGIHEIDVEKLIVVDVYNHRFHKLYTNDDTYSPHLDDLVVYETVEDHIAIPVYLREMKTEGWSRSTLFGRPFIINVKEATYENIFDAVSTHLKHFVKEVSDEVESDTDEGVSDCDVNEMFSLTQVSSYGTLDVEKLERNKEFKFDPKGFYLAADFSTSCRAKLVDEKEMEQDVVKLPFDKNAGGNETTVALTDCIQKFTKTEVLGADDPWFCRRCKKHQQATKKFELWSLPNVLVIQMKRFSYSRYWRDKLDTLVDFPISGLDMGSFIINPNHGDYLYDLVAVANHFGGLGGGHYTAYGKNRGTGNWYHFDDSRVSEASEDKVISKAAYVLVYQKRA